MKRSRTHIYGLAMTLSATVTGGAWCMGCSPVQEAAPERRTEPAGAATGAVAVEAPSSPVDALLGRGGAPTAAPYEPASMQFAVFAAVQKTKSMGTRDALVSLSSLLSATRDRAGEGAQSVVAAFAERLDSVCWSKLPVDVVWDAMTDAITHKSPAARTLAVRTLARFETPEAATWVTKALHDSEVDVRQLAAEVIGTMGEAVGGDELVAALRDVDPGVQRAAVKALCRLNFRPAIPHLVELLERTQDAEVRTAAVRMLSRLTGQQTLGSTAAEWRHWLNTRPQPASAGIEERPGLNAPPEQPAPTPVRWPPPGTR